MGEARVLIIEPEKAKEVTRLSRFNEISLNLPMQMVGGIVEEGVILANEFASNNERRWFGLHYHGSLQTLFFT